jgi:photosystem II stability/assembly factor-like uncharacterized protein
MSLRKSLLVVTALLVMLLAAVSLPARQMDAPSSKLFSDMKWRNIGPLRGGRTKAMAGVASQPFTFYMGMVNGGVWKTTNAARTWVPIFDDQPTGSIGAIAVSQSDPNIIYVGSGEGLQRPDLAIGDGMYKSTDAGKTWTHLGLRDSQQIPQVVVDPKNPDRLFVAVLGHPYGPNEERGIFRSTDGGKTFEKVLYKGPDVGGKDVDIDPANPDIVYAILSEQRQGPWENSAWAGTGGGVFKSTDGGTTWKPLTNGFPANLATAEMAIAPSDSKRLYARIAVYNAPGAGGGRGGGRGGGGAGATGPQYAPFYRSDDGGETWAPTTTDSRVGTSDEAVIVVDPKDPDWLVVTSQVTAKSTDGGKTWVPFKGAPGGDDYQNGWINPNNTDIMILVADQGAAVSLDKGISWSSWYNQPTAAMYHINTDNDFPYRVCGGQQDSGSACVSSRGVDGAITFREWHPAAVEEYGYAAPDPLDPNLVYGGKVSRYDRRTGQSSQVGPLAGRGAAAFAPAGGPPAPEVGRTVRTLPVVFSQADPHALFYGTNVMWKTMDGGINWKQISPDLTRKTHDVPKNIGKYSDTAKAQVDQNGARVIYTIGPSYKDINRIWAGTDDGNIQTTVDGGLHWTNVTPKEMTSYQKVFMVEPGRFDALTAYAAVNTLRLDDQNPHLYRTHDGGKTWTEIINGIPGGNAVSAIREDTKKKGLLFAGSETQVYVSFDDGDHWQSLRLNMAPSSVRDLIVKDDDLVAGTHGRGIWILDDITPLRQIDARTGAMDMLYKPETALRVRWNTNPDTPLPPDEPRMPNPPDGAILNYYLAADANGPVTIDVFRADGKLARRYSSTDVVPQLPDPATNAPLPLYWYRAPQHVETSAGMHRFIWDLHYQPLAAVPGGGGGRGFGRGGGPSTGAGRAGGGAVPVIGSLAMQAVPYYTVPSPTTPWVSPGEYTVKLTVNGKTYSQPLTVKQDPRVKTPALVMTQVYTLTNATYYDALAAGQAAREAQSLRDQIAKITTAIGDTAKALAAFDKQLADAGLAAAATGLSGAMNALQSADVTPTTNQLKTITNARTNGTAAMTKWTAIRTTGLTAINAKLKAAGLTPLSMK